MSRPRGIALVLLGAGALLVSCAPALTPAGTPLARDNFGRYTLPVTLNGTGPYPFILDTAAEMSMIAPHLADSLGLKAIPGIEVNVQGTAGRQASSFVNARELKCALFPGRMATMVVLPNAAISNAPGILGMNFFRGGRLEFDFPRSSARVGPSGATPAGFAPLRAQILRDAFALVDVTVNGIRAKALIDTGARRTLGNLALARALGFADDDPRLLPADPVAGASIDRMPARRAALEAIVLGPANFARPTIAFADAPMFKTQGRDKVPALILGIDLLSTLDALAIDYPRAELQVRP
jgi:predicted aspartyl protease